MPTTRRGMEPREAEIQRNALAWLKTRGIAAFRRNVIGVRAVHNGKPRFIRAGEPGMADVYGLMPPAVMPAAARETWGRFGRAFELEIKRPAQRPRLDQVLWLQRINAITGAAFWVTSVDMLDRVMTCLLSGGRVEYLETTRRYGNIVGPSGDYDCVWPD